MTLAGKFRAILAGLFAVSKEIGWIIEWVSHISVVKQCK
jgi:hypothetical protein